MRTALGIEIERLLGTTGLSQSQLAKIAKITPAMLSRILTGSVRNPTNETIEKIAKALRVNPDRLIALRDEERRRPEMRVGVAHTLWSAPVIVTAIEDSLEGIEFSSFGDPVKPPGVSSEPRFFSRHREAEVPCGPTPERAHECLLDNGAGKPPAPLIYERSAPANRKPYTAKDLAELLKDGKIDCLVAADSIHQHLGDRVVRCATILQTYGGVVPLLIMPKKLADTVSPNSSGGESGHQTERRWSWPLIGKLMKHLAEDPVKRKLRIVYSEHSSAHAQYHLFLRAIEKMLGRLPHDAMIAHSIDLGRWSEAIDALNVLQAPAQYSAVLYLVWEPHASWLLSNLSNRTPKLLYWEGAHQDISYQVEAAAHDEESTRVVHESIKGTYLEFAVYVNRSSLTRCIVGGRLEGFLSSVRGRIEALHSGGPMDEYNASIRRLAAYLDMPTQRCLRGLSQLNFAFRYYPEWDYHKSLHGGL